MYGYDDWTEGATVVGEIELSEPCYSYDTLMVLRNEQGYYLATDSGCSCPTPFEDYRSLADATGPLTADQAREEVTSLWSQYGEDGYDRPAYEGLLAEIV